ncbi:MAG: hemerythrin family protein [Acidaminococcales bacterium]|jgi:hemerythrin|nr:hemerythrin family protein [Acidaminococcales bacterium]
MPYEWDKSLETGHKMIDNQHKQLVAALNALIAACRSGQGHAEVANTMEFLAAYTIKHFADEEKLQAQYDYPCYLDHKRYHEEFKITVRGLTEELLREGPTDEVADKISSVIGNWLVNHIKGDDFKMAAFVKTMEK